MQGQANIFYTDTEFQEPLAHRMRPKNIDELVGSIKTNPAFLNWLSGGIKQSAIFWGPPGTGKTSIAQLAAQYSSKQFIKLQAFNSGVKDLREVIAQAEKMPGRIVLFVDEVHSFNKSQQDILLNAIERGILSFIGATTENPGVSINRALLSRVLKFELKPHSYEDLEKLVYQTLKKVEQFAPDSRLANHEDTELTSTSMSSPSDERNAEAGQMCRLSREAVDYLIKASYGDARHLLTNLELLINNSECNIDLELAKNIISKKLFAGDPNSYYDCISALQKSLRGSDVDASLYWLARLLSGGAELEAICRRILVTAAEDVGIADPQALVIANAAYQAAINLGMPEARIPLAQAVVYIAKAPKSNQSYKALDKAMNDCMNHPPYAVPEHLRNIHIDAGASLDQCPAKSNNFGINPITKYKYPHDYPGSWIEQQYLPDELLNKKYF